MKIAVVRYESSNKEKRLRIIFLFCLISYMRVVLDLRLIHVYKREEWGNEKIISRIMFPCMKKRNLIYRLTLSVAVSAIFHLLPLSTSTTRPSS